MNYILLIFSVIGGLVIGGLVVFLVNRYLLATRSKTILEEAEKEAEVIKKNKPKWKSRRMPAMPRYSRPRLN